MAQRELPEGAGHLLLDLLGGLIVGISARLPRCRLDLVHLAFDLAPHARLLEPRDARERPVDPALVWIGAQKDHFSADLEEKRRIRWVRAVAELARDACLIRRYV